MEKMAHPFFSKASRENWLDHKKIKNSINFVLVFFIICFAAFLRLYRIEDYMTFLGDEGRDVLVVYNILHGKLTLLGPTASVGGFFLGPIYYYFMTPFLWLFNYNPVGPAVMVALFGIATVFLIYKIGGEFFGIRVGLVSAFLYSISPLVIAYSRSSWNPNLMPFFSLLTMYVLYKAISRDKIMLFILCGFLFGILMQLHYLTLFLGIIAISYILITKRKIWLILKGYFYMLIGFIIGWSPFLAFEIRHEFTNIKSIMNFIFNSDGTGGNINFLPTIYDAFFRLFARLVANFPPSEQMYLYPRLEIAIWYILVLAVVISGALIVFYRLIRASVQKNKEELLKYSLVALWFLAGIGLFGFYKKSIYDYYFGFMFPLPFFFTAILINRLLRKKIFVIFGISVFIWLVFINLKGMPFLFPANRQLRQIETISKFVLEKAEGKPFNFGLITGGNSDHAYRYFFTIWNKSPIKIDILADDPQRETVTDQLLVVCETSPCHPLGDAAWEVAGFGRAEIESEWEVSVVKVFKLKHYRGND